MEGGMDALRCLDDDTAIHILKYLEAFIDVASASLVSRSWRRFVMEGRLWKHMCLTEYPELNIFEGAIEVGNGKCPREAAASSEAAAYEEALEKEHRIYSLLCSELRGPPFSKRSCISTAIAASSTDNLPQESIYETLYPLPLAQRDPLDGQTWSYWSSTGQATSDVSETLTYRLLSPLCVVHEIKIRPFQAEFQNGNPVYSAKYVRIRLGFERQSGSNLGDRAHRGSSSSCLQDYTWTYESPEFPMEQMDELQSFKLPRPVLCIGQILQVELLGRVQTQQLDSLYYICVCHVSVLGRPISNFDFSYMGDRGGYVLIHARSPHTTNSLDGTPTQSDARVADEGGYGWHSFTERIRQLRSSRDLWHNRFLLNRLLGNIAGARMLLAGEGPFTLDDEHVLEDQDDESEDSDDE